MYKYLVSSLSGVIHDSGGVTRYVYSCTHVLTCLYVFVYAAAISMLFKCFTRDKITCVKECACADTVL